jgi:pSer/pThr/pTyr-binding forkhead associated (FHA) protein
MPTPQPVNAPKDTSKAVAQGHYLRLVHIHPDGSEGESLSLTIQEVTVGREHAWEIFERDPYLSPRHVTFFFKGQGAYLRDEGGLNGTFVKLKGTAELSDGDLFRAGQQLFRFEQLKQARGVQAIDGTRRLGAPLYQNMWGRLAHVVGHGEVGEAWVLSDETIDIGRVRGSITFNKDRFMSGAHCTLAMTEGRATLTDRGSTNGTFLRVHGTVPISHNDLVLLGQQIFRIDLGLA